ncbi:Uncharacterised protein [Mycobacteroides abscessus subsp. abscessus]|uniref:hypothetical protein n=1 Tax=Mycobacteroides abscessus TaxID=36809 RepID=UPI000927C4AA|nr:hypothetical protein [Mycobacteroides abscessus]SHV15203.1 Uncharacterised protein [Mycobacteroides abscessus subsp. abscessus]SKD11177.1 Uncharacterised protein [Mycobacteroides abscessus subsp. abscessus]SKL38058.1 Uncharacterised protein [Mycobacteroides abscessus subsp. abscessus]SKM28327.1 Uncharacterised protein [Mycobacteroides abscessus subsp. abscessus]
MSKTRRVNNRRGARGTRKADRNIIVRGERLDPPDLRKLSRAVIAIAMRDAEAKADARAAEKGTTAPDDEWKGAA